MSKEEQVMRGLRDVLNKMGWLNKLKMEDNLKGYKSSDINSKDKINCRK